MMNKLIVIEVDAAAWEGELAHTWNYVGYDECNYTHSPGGMELIRKFGRLEKPYYMRAHHMLCTGNCHGAYKWGSTNAYTEDAGGNPVYSFGLIDRMCDIWLQSGCKPFFEIGFMPMDLADADYAAAGGNRFAEYRRAGWNRPPKDYGKWHDLIRALISHLLSRYGREELDTWYFEMWNEPDIMYWNGTHGEFCKLYDYTEAAVHAALPSARFGGPATCGPMTPDSKAAVFLRDFLIHTKSGINYVTGAAGTRIDFTSFHTKGGGYQFTTSPEREKTPSVKRLLDQVRVGGDIVNECGYGGLECVLSEADPDGWAAGGRFDNPAFEFRNTEYYASYVASAYKNIYDMAREMKIDFRPLAWAFMFEGERCFEGTRAFSTQGIDKAVFNLFKMYARLGRQLVKLESGLGGSPERRADYWNGENDAEIDGWATLTGEKSVEIMLYCHADTWDSAAEYPVSLNVKNIPFPAPYRVTHHRIDKSHSNACREWERLGRPDYPAGPQYDAIKAADGLEQLRPPEICNPGGGDGLRLEFTMPVKSVSLITLTPAITG